MHLLIYGMTHGYVFCATLQDKKKKKKKDWDEDELFAHVPVMGEGETESNDKTEEQEQAPKSKKVGFLWLQMLLEGSVSRLISRNVGILAQCQSCC